MSHRCSVVLADDHAVVRAGITRTVAEQASAAAGDAAKEATDSLYERLKNNDFRHVEERIESTVAKIDRGLAEARADREAMESRLSGWIDRVEVRIGERFDRARQDRRDMEARILAAVQRRPGTEAEDLEA